MIFYFSATGNSLYAARRLAEATGEELYAVPELLRAGRTAFAPEPGERVGFVFPTYFWGLPALGEDFLRRLRLRAPEGTYLYLAATCGVTPGAMGAFADRLLRRQGLHLSARFSVKMPDTWTPIFDLSDRARVDAINAAAEKQIDAVVSAVLARETGDHMRLRAPLWIAAVFARPIFKMARTTARFAVSEKCVGCGLCARQCPAQAIELRAGRPVWVKERCELCLGCLHGCPQFAITRGAATARHGQYRNPSA